MTAEIGILNLKGVALAADSAVTIGGAKVMNNARKLFTLDSAHSIGIMIFENADYRRIPWELIINAFRDELGNKTLKNVNEYCNSFFSFIKHFDEKFGNDDFFGAGEYANELLDTVLNKCKTSDDTLRDVIGDLIPDTLQQLDGFEFDENKVFSDLLKFFSQNYFKKTKTELDSEIAELLVHKLGVFIRSQLFSNSQTGIVIAGYGDTDMFPQLFEYRVDGIEQGNPKVKLQDQLVLGVTNGTSTGSINPFAQQEMVHTVLQGMDPRLSDLRENQLDNMEHSIEELVADSPEKILSVKNIFQSNKAFFTDYKQKNFSDPVVQMVSVLSLPEMAAMAKTLVSLTSFKRKFSNAMETVGGPIDVLVISKGEGPIWIDRKKYFDKDDNLGYVNRKGER